MGSFECFQSSVHLHIKVSFDVGELLCLFLKGAFRHFQFTFPPCSRFSLLYQCISLCFQFASKGRHLLVKLSYLLVFELQRVYWRRF